LKPVGALPVLKSAEASVHGYGNRTPVSVESIGSRRRSQATATLLQVYTGEHMRIFQNLSAVGQVAVPASWKKELKEKAFNSRILKHRMPLEFVCG
jgi:hypothetical protein